MTESLPPAELPSPGMGLEECVSRAETFISRNGVCLLVLDIIESSKYPDRAKLFDDYEKLLEDLNAKFDEHLPTNKLTHLKRVDKGFTMVLGDGATAGIDDATIIEQIMKYVEQHPAALPLRYSVAEDCYDEVGIRLLK